jgi:hypothetical protein
MPSLPVLRRNLFCSSGSNPSRLLQLLQAIRTLGSGRLCADDRIPESNVDPYPPMLSPRFWKDIYLSLPSEVWGIGITAMASMPYYVSDGDMFARIYLHTY